MAGEHKRSDDSEILESLKSTDPDSSLKQGGILRRKKTPDHEELEEQLKHLNSPEHDLHLGTEGLIHLPQTKDDERQLIERLHLDEKQIKLLKESSEYFKRQQVVIEEQTKFTGEILESFKSKDPDSSSKQGVGRRTLANLEGIHNLQKECATEFTDFLRGHTDPEVFLEKQLALVEDMTRISGLREDARSFDSFASRKELENATDECLQEGNIPSQEYLLRAIKFYGRKHYMVTKLCNAVSKHIVGLSEKVKTVTASYTISKDLVFVIRHHDVVDHALHDAAVRYQVYFRKVNCVSNEAEKVSYRYNYVTETFSKEETLNLEKAISQRSPYLFRDHSNLNVITSSHVKSTEFMGDKVNLAEQTCIVLYVSVKGFIPLAEEAFPTKIGGYETDVMEGYFSVFHKPANEQHEDLKAGCEIHCPGSGLTGTIGPFVAFENKTCFLTCCHLICNDEEKRNLIDDHSGKFNVDPTCNIPIFQPNYSEDSKEIGKVIQLVFKEGDTTGNPGMDVAVVEITDRHPITGTFPECSAYMCTEIGYNCQSELVYSGKACSGPEDIQRGSVVVMFGSQSGLTRGLLRTNVTAVRTTDFVMSGSPYTLYNQLEISGINNSAGVPFAKQGDSGALVFLQNVDGSLVALGLLVGGTPSGQYIATPIWDIYKEIKCKPMIFGEGPRLPRQQSVKERPMSQEFDHFRIEMRNEVDNLREYIDTKFNNIDTRFNNIDTNIKQSFQAMASLLEKTLKESK